MQLLRALDPATIDLILFKYSREVLTVCSVYLYVLASLNIPSHLPLALTYLVLKLHAEQSSEAQLVLFGF